MFGLTPLFKVQIRPLILYTIRFLGIFLPIKMSHSMYMLSIQIDTQKFESVKQHQIVLLYKSYEISFKSTDLKFN